MTRVIGYQEPMSTVAFLLTVAAATGSPQIPTAQPAAQFRAISGATARATMTIRVVNGASFGSGYLQPVSGAAQRDSQIRNAQGVGLPAKLLEFQ